jgi:hypothetical protein
MTDLDQLLIRASEIFLEDLADETDAELGELLPPLVEADKSQLMASHRLVTSGALRSKVCGGRKNSATSSDIREHWPQPRALRPAGIALLASSPGNPLTPDRTVEILGGGVFGFGGHS